MESLFYLWVMNETQTHPKVGMNHKGYTLKGYNKSKSKSFPGCPSVVFYTMLLENETGDRRCVKYNPETGSIGDFEKEFSGSTKGSFYKTWYDCDLNENNI